MTTNKDPVKHLLNLALATAMNDLQFYQDEFDRTESPEAKALLLVLQESEEALISAIEEMMVSGIFSAIEEARKKKYSMVPPDEAPFDFASPFSTGLQFDRWAICNRTLERGVKAYTFYLSIAARAKSEMVSILFQYIAYLKAKHIKRLRKVCESFKESSE